MDPTPTLIATVAASRWESLRRLGESVRLQWDRLFVRFSAKDQLAVVHGLREGGDALREKMSRWVTSMSDPINRGFSRLSYIARTFQPGMQELVMGAMVVGLALLLLMLRDRLGLWATSHLPISRPQFAIVQLYTRMLRIMEKRGMRKTPAATPREFAKLVEQQWRAASPMVADVTNLYHRGRFSRAPLTTDELSHAAELVRRLQSLTEPAR
jgi:hypothetical protein